MGMSWTKEQEQVIRLRNRNILVSAAAGSGKTAVLVERIITRLTVDEPPIDVDRMLVVTFTEAAASEMKERIRDAIEKKLLERPDDVRLQRQATLIHSAQVTTIHSFCLSVIRDYFHTIDLDPGFRIAEEGELKLLKQDVLGEVLERCYEEGSPQFLDCVESFASGRDDRKLEEIILQIYEFSRSDPNPDEWMERCRAAYQVSGGEEFERSESIVYAKRYIRRSIEDNLSLLAEARRQCMEPDGPGMYLEMVESDIGLLEKLAMAESLGEMYERAAGMKWKTLSRKKGAQVSEELRESVKGIRDGVKASVKKLVEQMLYEPPEEMRADMCAAYPNICMLMELVKRFADAFEERKRSRNMIDFGDMEQYALRILTRKTPDGLVPSDAARDYQKKFAEVMIDEYQDSNLIQEAILTSVSTVSEGRYNLFMVGDVKQSIYRFRLSRPELFMEKFDTYHIEESEKQRIDLHKNFRSRREVLDSANFLFEQMMTKELGEIAYDERAALYVGADYEEQPGNETEVLFVNTDVEEEDREFDETARELEARAAVRRIKELVKSQQVFDRRTGGYRTAKYSDIVILTRSLRGWTDVFTEVLNREGIPTFTGSREGYFETREIRLLLDYLRVIDNPRQDLPLAAVLTSMFAGLTSEELAKVKCHAREQQFYEAVLGYEEDGEDEALRRKLADCRTRLASFRDRVPYTAIHELLWEIVEETGYGSYVAAMPGGEQRSANLEMLIEKAMGFESTSYKGLFHFIRYIEQLQKYNVDYGEANLADEQADTVRLMSIHKSKGLEFPIVIVAGMSKRFNMQDTRGSIIIHPEFGVGIDAVDTGRRVKTPTFLKKIMQRNVHLESMGEELRVLYVALTRAKEKLILIGTVSRFDKKLAGFASVRNREETALPFGMLAKASTYFDWIIPALFRNQAFAGILEKYEISAPFANPLYRREVPVLVRELGVEEIVAGQMAEEIEGFLTSELLDALDVEAVYDEGMKAQLEEQFDYQYPYQALQKMKLKFTVSELKKRKDEADAESEALYGEEPDTAECQGLSSGTSEYGEESQVLCEDTEAPDILPLVPKFMRGKEEPGGASRGTAYHKVLELLDFGRRYTDSELARALEAFREKGRIGADAVRAVYRRDILRLLESPLGRRLLAASQAEALKKEQPFVLGVDAGQIYPEAPEELLLVQGIIDAYFEEGGELVVVDYKTDRVRGAEELLARYAGQLDYYAQALERVTGKRVKEKLIYSFSLGQEIRV